MNHIAIQSRLRGGFAGSVLLTALATLALAPAHAATVTASGEYFLNGGSAEFQSNSSALSALAFVEGAAAFSRIDGVLNVSAGSGGVVATLFGFPPVSGAESFEAISTWESTITNGSSGPVNYRFLFNVVFPRLGTTGDADDFAGLGIDILLDGSSVWSAFARFDGCSLDFDNMGGTPTVFDCNAEFPAFDAGVDLGSYGPGESFTLRYVMTAFVNSAEINGFSYAAIGDPFFPQGAGATIVPVPAAFALFLSALASFGFFGTRRRSLAQAGRTPLT